MLVHRLVKPCSQHARAWFHKPCHGVDKTTCTKGRALPCAVVSDACDGHKRQPCIGLMVDGHGSLYGTFKPAARLPPRSAPHLAFVQAYEQGVPTESSRVALQSIFAAERSREVEPRRPGRLHPHGPEVAAGGAGNGCRQCHDCITPAGSRLVCRQWGRRRAGQRYGGCPCPPQPSSGRHLSVCQQPEQLIGFRRCLEENSCSSTSADI